MTVSRRLTFQFVLKSFTPARKARLTAAMELNLLVYFVQHETCAADDCSNVVFSDESRQQQLVMPDTDFRKHHGKRFDEKYTIQAMKQPQSQKTYRDVAKSGTPGTSMNGASLFG